MKIKKRKHAKNSSVLCLCYILRAIGAGRRRERRYADHIFIQIYFRMHRFVVKFSKSSSPQAARGHWPPNQNPADVSAHVSFWAHVKIASRIVSYRILLSLSVFTFSYPIVSQASMPKTQLDSSGPVVPIGLRNPLVTDRQTDRRTYRYMATADTALA